MFYSQLAYVCGGKKPWQDGKCSTAVRKRAENTVQVMNGCNRSLQDSKVPGLSL